MLHVERYTADILSILSKIFLVPELGFFNTIELCTLVNEDVVRIILDRRFDDHELPISKTLVIAMNTISQMA